MKTVGSSGLREDMHSDILLENSEMLQIKGAAVFIQTFLLLLLQNISLF